MADIDRSGVEVQVRLVDYNRSDEDGNAYAVMTRHHFTNYELAKTNQREFVEQVLSMSSRDILGEFRGDDYE